MGDAGPAEAETRSVAALPKRGLADDDVMAAMGIMGAVVVMRRAAGYGFLLRGAALELEGNS
jgi:hypothetical protein